VGGKQEVDKDIASGMCQTTWKIVLNALSQLLARCSSEEIILQLLKVHKAFVQRGDLPLRGFQPKTPLRAGDQPLFNHIHHMQKD